MHDLVYLETIREMFKTLLRLSGQFGSIADATSVGLIVCRSVLVPKYLGPEVSGKHGN